MYQPCPQCETVWHVEIGPHYLDVTPHDQLPEEWQNVPLHQVPFCYHVFVRDGDILFWHSRPQGIRLHYCPTCGVQLPDERLYSEWEMQTMRASAIERETGPVRAVPVSSATKLSEQSI